MGEGKGGGNDLLLFAGHERADDLIRRTSTYPKRGVSVTTLSEQFREVGTELHYPRRITLSPSFSLSLLLRAIKRLQTAISQTSLKTDRKNAMR